MDIDVYYNAFEVALWFIMGAILLVRSNRALIEIRNLGRIAGIAFFFFSISDAIEIQTGAWWRPWELLLLKTVCVLVLMWCYISYKRILKIKQLQDKHVKSIKVLQDITH